MPPVGSDHTSNAYWRRSVDYLRLHTVSAARVLILPKQLASLASVTDILVWRSLICLRPDGPYGAELVSTQERRGWQHAAPRTLGRAGRAFVGLRIRRGIH